MRIGIVGNYGNNNNGDEAILAGIITQVKQFYNVGNEDITVFSNNPKQTSELYGVRAEPLYYRRPAASFTFFQTFRKNSKVVATLDLLIIGGGGILMDFYNREAQLFGSYGMMARFNKVPYIVYGCGAGPIRTPMGKWFIKNLLKGADTVSVRDPESKKLLHSIGVKREILVIGDPSFALSLNCKKERKKLKRIGVTVVPYYDKNYWPDRDDAIYKQYIHAMAENLDRIIQETDVTIELFSTKYPHDVDVTVDVLQLMHHKEQVAINKEDLSPERLLEITSNLDLLIGTRLHSVYLAVNAETPVLAISYHTKVKDFMGMVGLEERVVTIPQLLEQPGILLEKVKIFQKDYPSEVHRANQLKHQMIEMAELGEKQLEPYH